MTPKAIQDLLDELEASRASRKRAWEILQELRWVLKDDTGIEPPEPSKKTIDLEGRIVKTLSARLSRNGRKRLATRLMPFASIGNSPINRERFEVPNALMQFLELNKAIDRADQLLR
jgi:hypothetical protein